MTPVTLAAPVGGWLINVRDVPDPVFAEEMLGTGVAIDPVEGLIVAPCAAQVLLVAPTRHSVTLRTDEGAELLIHIGLETMALGGRGFEAHVASGDRVASGDPLLSFDLDRVALEARSLLTPLILTNPGEFALTLEPQDRLVERGQPIGSIRSLGAVAAEAAASGAEQRIECRVGFAHGLHARPAGRLADCAKGFASEILLSARGASANARSPTAVMALNLAAGDQVTVSATGPDSQAALAAIAAVLAAGDRDQARAARPAPAAPPLADNELAGVCAMPGAAVGPAFRWTRPAIEIPEQGQGVAAERAALHNARAAARARLETLAADVGGAGGDIARAHIALIDDADLDGAALAAIDSGKSAARAWQMATQSAAASLAATGNPRMQERIADLADIGAQLVAAMHGDAAAGGSDLPVGAILIADDLLPSELLSLDRARLAGIAIGQGGPTSHVAIIAASLGVPTLVAVGASLLRVAAGATVLIDADAGRLVIAPSPAVAARALAAAGDGAAATGECATRDGVRISLLANLGSLAEVDAALAAGAEGCGLLRTEFLFLDRADAPGADEQAGAYQAIAHALGGRPLTIRTLDIGGDKPVPFIAFPAEQNPALGARGIRTRLIAPDVLDEQLRAIAGLRGAAIKAMIPMVSSPSELRDFRRRFAELGGGATIKLGVMIETPAAALIADRLAADADFLSIGSNDLAQYALAMDRTNPLLAAAIDALHPAVLRLIAMTVVAARGARTPVSLCGNLAADPAGALVLIGLGLRELSGVPAALGAVRRAIGRVSLADCEQLAERVLAMESAAEVRSLAAALIGSTGAGE